MSRNDSSELQDIIRWLGFKPISDLISSARDEEEPPATNTGDDGCAPETKREHNISDQDSPGEEISPNH
jgi:hypothetical protein